MKVEAAYDESTWRSASALTGLVTKEWCSARRSKELQHNNGMHPTAKSVAFMRKTLAIHRFVAAGDAWRWAASPSDGAALLIKARRVAQFLQSGCRVGGRLG